MILKDLTLLFSFDFLSISNVSILIFSSYSKNDCNISIIILSKTEYRLSDNSHSI